MALVTLALLKSILNIPATDVSEDDELQFALDAASEAVASFTDRNFALQGPTPTPSVREYEYDGSGWLDIDDCTNITQVSIGDRVLGADDWHAHPLNKLTFHYLVLHDTYYGHASPEMGFKWNADKLLPYHPVRPTIIAVTAAWGWPSIPYHVQQAVIWTAIAIRENPRPYVTESIEGYSRTVGEAPVYLIPPRAQDALQPYVRIKV